jgi:hypothetical protein
LQMRARREVASCVLPVAGFGDGCTFQKFQTKASGIRCRPNKASVVLLQYHFWKVLEIADKLPKFHAIAICLSRPGQHAAQFGA